MACTSCHRGSIATLGINSDLSMQTHFTILLLVEYKYSREASIL